MAVYKVQNFVSGKWVDKKEVMANKITQAVIVTETEPEPSQWKDDEGNVQTQDVCKVKFDGLGDEALKVALNKVVIRGLAGAFGEDSRLWIGKPLQVETEKTRVGGKAGIALYLIPEGYEKVDNEDGYAEIRKMGFAQQTSKDDIPVIEEDQVDVKDIPF